MTGGEGTSRGSDEGVEGELEVGKGVMNRVLEERTEACEERKMRKMHINK